MHRPSGVIVASLVLLATWCAAASAADVRIPGATVSTTARVGIMGDIAAPRVYDFTHPRISLEELLHRAGGLTSNNAAIRIYRKGRMIGGGHASTLAASTARNLISGDLVVVRSGDQQEASPSQPATGTDTGQRQSPMQIAAINLGRDPVIMLAPPNVLTAGDAVVSLNQQPAALQHIVSGSHASRFATGGPVDRELADFDILVFDATKVRPDLIPLGILPGTKQEPRQVAPHHQHIPAITARPQPLISDISDSSTVGTAPESGTPEGFVEGPSSKRSGLIAPLPTAPDLPDTIPLPADDQPTGVAATSETMIDQEPVRGTSPIAPEFDPFNSSRSAVVEQSISENVTAPIPPVVSAKESDGSPGTESPREENANLIPLNTKPTLPAQSAALPRSLATVAWPTIVGIAALLAVLVYLVASSYEKRIDRTAAAGNQATDSQIQSDVQSTSSQSATAKATAAPPIETDLVNAKPAAAPPNPLAGTERHRLLESLIQNRVPITSEELEIPDRLEFYGTPTGQQRLRVDAAHTELNGPHVVPARERQIVRESGETEHTELDTHLQPHVFSTASVAGQPGPGRRAGRLDRALSRVHGEMKR